MFHVTLYNLSVRIDTNVQNVINFIEHFIAQFYTSRAISTGSEATTPADRKFYSRIENTGTFFLHVNQFKHLLHYGHQRTFPFPQMTREDKRAYRSADEDYRVRDGWVPKPVQVPIIEFLTTDPRMSKMVALQTGGGKTFVSLYSLAQLKKRFAVMVLLAYGEKWINDIKGVHTTNGKDIFLIQGGDSIRSAVNLALSGELEARYLVFSITTLQDFIKRYEANPEACVLRYGITPIELFPILGINTLLVDETHQHFHSVFRILLHSNVNFQIGLSATLLTDDPVVKRVHDVVYPKNWVYDPGELNRYADVYALTYSMPPQALRSIKTSHRGSSSYSHTAFEQSVMAVTNIKHFYLRLIEGVFLDFFVQKYEAGDKCLIFVGTVKMASLLTKYLTEKFPEYSVKRYCEEDPFDNLLTADVSVSTIISAGTAVDIPDLRVVIQTVSVSSTVANVQSLGRLRELKNKDVRFCYLFAENINKQKTYHYKRKELFRDRVATQSIQRARLA
ncbi:MAG: DEAD/DEAH box helicase family protein [Candidatus Nanopelagicales bacterium]|nr:DEAD/DEAH box helicase family protein [Candidatus Nanopelagicales bacterium]